MSSCIYIWCFHSDVTIVCLKGNKMRYHERVQWASWTKDECIQASSSLYTSLHNHPFLAIGWQWKNYLYMVFSLKWDHIQPLRWQNEIPQIWWIWRTKDWRTQVSVRHDTYQASLPGHRQTMKPLFIWYFHSNVAIIFLKSNKTRLPGAAPQPIGLFLFCIVFGWGWTKLIIVLCMNLSVEVEIRWHTEFGRI